MFKVIDKYGNIQTVYGLNGTYFLIYGAVEPEDEISWRYIEMSDCKPLLYSIEQEKQVKQEETKTNLKYGTFAMKI